MDNRCMSQLLDELYTAEFIVIASDDDRAREHRHKLGNVITGKTLPLLGDMVKYREFQRLADKLRGVAFERLMIMRRIDDILASVEESK